MNMSGGSLPEAEALFQRIWGYLGKGGMVYAVPLDRIMALDMEYAARIAQQMQDMYESQMQDVRYAVNRGSSDPHARRVADDCEYIVSYLVSKGVRAPTKSGRW
jgi:hypothetical protein